MTTTHSPLPWSEQGGIITAGISPGQPYIADCRFGPMETREGNARLIIESVNNYALLKGNRDHYKAHADKLAECLEGLFRHCSMVHKHWGDGSNQAEADAVISAAKAELAAYEAAQA